MLSHRWSGNYLVTRDFMQVYLHIHTHVREIRSFILVETDSCNYLTNSLIQFSSKCVNFKLVSNSFFNSIVMCVLKQFIHCIIYTIIISFECYHYAG